MQSADIVFAVIALLFVVGATLSALVARRIRTRHADTWEALEAPKLLSDSSWSSTRRLRRYLKNGELLELNDARLNRLVLAERLFGWLYLLAFALFGAIILWARFDRCHREGAP